MDDQVSPTEYSIRRIGQILHRITPVTDSAGKLVQYLTKPLMVELRKKDIGQILVGASLLSIPVAFTSEVWELGVQLPMINIVALVAISLAFIALFVYFNFYRDLFSEFRLEYFKRVVAIYILSAAVVGVLLTLIQVAPWGTDNVVAFKRIVLVTFPASMSAALSDTLG
jgi:uncharacterized membrane protein